MSTEWLRPVFPGTILVLATASPTSPGPLHSGVDAVTTPFGGGVVGTQGAGLGLSPKCSFKQLLCFLANHFLVPTTTVLFVQQGREVVRRVDTKRIVIWHSLVVFHRSSR